MDGTPTHEQALLAAQALAALVRDDWPEQPLADLAFIHGGSGLTDAHYEALRVMEAWLDG